MRAKPNAWMNLRYTDDKRAKAFMGGIERLGYAVCFGNPVNVTDRDILITWNRIGNSDRIAKQFEARGNKVLVAENSSWGNSFAGSRWYHIARNYHNTANTFDVFHADRWDSLNIDLQPFRCEGETVILPQRGIGSPPVAMPRWFIVEASKKYGGRIRKHPGKYTPKTTLEDDLSNCQRVVTWGSGAAVKALMMGCKVVSYYDNWIAQQDNTEAGRLEMFRRLAWAQWTLEEIAGGDAFECLLT